MAKVTQAGFIEGNAAATPPTGVVVLYAKSTGVLYSKDDAGVETQLGTPGSSPGTVTDISVVTSGGFSGTVANASTTPAITLSKVIRVQSVTDAATITPNADTNDCIDITAIAQAFTIANPTGTPANFQKIIIRIKDNGTARAITWGTGYVAGGVALPSTTVLGKILNLGFQYNTANSLNKWQLIASAQEA